MDKPPIFVIGCPRSGTTLLRLLLDSHPHISAGPETHFLVDFERLTQPLYWKRLERFGFDRAYWDTRIATLFDEFQMDYARKRGKRRWCEKTPKYTEHLDYLDRLFPEARYLHLIRAALDVAASYRDRWGFLAGLRSARIWRDYVTRARTFGASIGPDRYHEIRYETLVEDPEGTMRPTLAFLDEPWDDAVLDYTQAEHDNTDRYAAFTSGRREQGGEDGTIYRSRVGAGARELTPLLRLWVRSRTESLMREIGAASRPAAPAREE